VRVLGEGGLDHGQIGAAFLAAETYGDLDDYLRAVAEVWGQEAAQRISTEIERRTAQLVDKTRLLDVRKPRLAGDSKRAMRDWNLRRSLL
jgi:hypothetical protein